MIRRAQQISKKDIRARVLWRVEVGTGGTLVLFLELRVRRSGVFSEVLCVRGSKGMHVVVVDVKKSIARRKKKGKKANKGECLCAD